MSVRTLYLRTAKYLQRHGLKSSVKRVWQEAQNRVLYNRNVFYCRDLLQGELESPALPENCRVERYETISEIPERLFRRIAEHHSEELILGYFQKRFEKGAHLWCLRSDTEDIGYLWSIEGRSMKPYYYFPLTARDVHLDDGFIFPPHRGHGMFYVLNMSLFNYYKNEGFHRVYQEVREWNTASIKSAAKNGFVRICLTRKKIRRGKCQVTWWY
jgi:L-amino acid N-acyltransferase YncA